MSQTGRECRETRILVLLTH